MYDFYKTLFECNKVSLVLAEAESSTEIIYYSI